MHVVSFLRFYVVPLIDSIKAIEGLLNEGLTSQQKDGWGKEIDVLFDKLNNVLKYINDYL